jgi:hypothetical protein
MSYESMSYESKKSGFIVFNLVLIFHFYVHQVIFCLFLRPSVCLSVRKIFTEVLRNFVYKEYSYARDQSINQSINYCRCNGSVDKILHQ